MNCRTCNWPYAPHELSPDGDCIRCVQAENIRMKEELKRAIALIDQTLDKVETINVANHVSQPVSGGSDS